ncbi:MAG: metalloregulator ArsR/SmtB family transcription factor [Armatimonadota bacterium]
MDKLFKALSDPNRIKIIEILANRGEACVCRLNEEIDICQSSLSHHMTILKNAGLVESRREGQWIHYSIVPSALQEMNNYLRNIITNVKNTHPSTHDSICQK